MIVLYGTELKSPTSLVFAIASVCTAWTSAPAFANDAANAGKTVFEVCGFCHSVEAEKNGIGPTLQGVLGRRSASIRGYEYSEAMSNYNVTWDEATLDIFLASPLTVVDGTTMTYSGLESAEDRKNVIAYLKMLRE